MSSTGNIAEDDHQLIKFHGSYIQDDRDVRGERAKKKLEKAFSFMLRLRIPGGVLSAKQWIALDDIASTYANGTLRLTTRETFQYHGVIKSNLKRTMQAINEAALDTIAACGDVNRNVMTASNPYLSKAHKAAYDLGVAISTHLLPKTGAYHEIWLDGEKVEDATRPAKTDEEPLYGVHYLPRKFKTVIAVPPDNDVDIFAHDLGYIAILEKGEIIGWNVTVGGGMGMTHGDLNTFPAHRRHARLRDARAGDQGRRMRADHPARLGKPRKPGAGPPQVHDRRPRPRRLPRRSREARRLQIRQAQALQVHVDRRPTRLAAGRGQELELDAVRRERPHQGFAGLDAQEGAPRDRRRKHLRVRRDRQPERHHGQGRAQGQSQDRRRS